MKRLVWSRLRAAAALLLLLRTTSAVAETTASQRASAEALFQQATQLMDEKRYAEACEKLAGSQDLDPALGTMLYLADCYEHAGRSASAWALFHEAADSAQQTGQLERQRIALERATSLEQRLSKLEVRVPAARQVPGLELLVNGALVPRASWNTGLPVDPGPTRIEARAPDKKGWKTTLTVTEGPSTQTVDMQPLANAPRKPKPAAAAPFDGPHAGSTQRTVGYVMTGAGVVALVVSSYFGYRAYALNKQSKAECRADAPNACTPDGVALREDAKTAGALSTIGTVSGGLLVVSGITLIVAAPATSAARDEPASARNFAPALGLSLRGVW
jgi:tetratricopeptide (TPR) repeat protein